MRGKLPGLNFACTHDQHRIVHMFYFAVGYISRFDGIRSVSGLLQRNWVADGMADGIGFTFMDFMDGISHQLTSACAARRTSCFHTSSTQKRAFVRTIRT